ncbi:DNA-binding LacI/PurR family transcriptional regulator [Paenarthrobacter nitroguajacolicus]|uniref:LacI family DNA-binding transcriptional regulator n=1 Tax=Paenarthrobacter nitroguajacolicus TaxID=211146 RepID=UPI00285E2CE0|nr:LacI family DNA-binding transcriptional regulator [Paenarthrobacter nitroguajacolicus]MDR6989275.1 DNA-binding LacI/PurR family transcriptional regulator [Paenarthrobacter nitroguajacolicus]
MGSPTIIDLANHLGISKTTVADALRGSGRVSEETRRRVQEAARQVGYVSNRAARQLRGNLTEAIALYVPPSVRNMSFYMPFALGVADQAAEYDYDLTLIAQRPVGGHAWASVDGVIVVDAVLADPVVQSLIRHTVPLVTAGQMAGFPADRLSGTIEIDYTKMCHSILDEMAQRGVTHPALISPQPADEHSWSRQLVDGYHDWCSTRNVPANAVTLPAFPSTTELEGALLGAVSQSGTDAVLFGWQDIAIRAEAILSRLGFQVGKNLQLASLVSSQENLHDTYVAGLDLRPYEFGQAASRLLRDVIENPQAAISRRHHDAKITFPKTTAASAI